MRFWHLALLGSYAHGQFGQWADGQVNTTLCVWNQPRAALIRDTVYLDGGSIWWTPGMKDGTAGTVVNEGNYQGNMLSFNLSRSFDNNANVTGILLDGLLSKARGGRGNSNDAAPNYYDGAMLYNDNEFFLYGGTILDNHEVGVPPEFDDVLEYQAFQYGAKKDLWNPGFYDRQLSDNVTRYIAYGGAANAPSEKKSWYFSGLSAPSRGPIYTNAGTNATVTATKVSDTLITLDTASQLQEIWTNATLPDFVKGRANPEVLWVPVGKQGVLVVLGGVTYPEWAGTTRSHKSDNETASMKESAEFMRVIDIYDVASQKWYKQPTENPPSPRTRGCAVVAPAPDFSSFNVYYYGGFNGIHPQDDFYDEVWVLSLPSFTWALLNKGTAAHARAGHRCFLPYPDQMMIIGGYTALTGDTLNCLADGPVVMFNVSSGVWMDGYDPARYSTYKVPDKVSTAIGVTQAIQTKNTHPKPSGWSSKELGDIFAIKYDTSKIAQYWPYRPANSTGGSTPSDNDSPHSDSGLASWVAPVLGVTLGLVLVIGVTLAYCFWRRKLLSRSDASSFVPAENAMKIMSWIRGHHHHHHGKHLTQSSATYFDPASPSPKDDMVVRQRSTSSGKSAPPYHEMGDTQVLEMSDTSTPVELCGTGLSPLEIAQKRSGLSLLPPVRPAPATLPELARQISPSSISIASELHEMITPTTGKAQLSLVSPIGDSTLEAASPGSAGSPPSVGERQVEGYVSAGGRLREGEKEEY